MVEMRYKACGGHTTICGIGGDFQPDPLKLYSERVTVSNYDVYGATPDVITGTCTQTYTETQATDYVEEGESCPAVDTDTTTDCGTTTACGAAPKQNCRDFTGNDTPTYSGEKPAAPAPTRVCEAFIDWGDTLGAAIDKADFRGNISPVATEGLSGTSSSISFAYSEYIASHFEFQFRLKAGAVLVPVRIHIISRQYLDSGGGAYTEIEDDVLIPIDGSAVDWTVPDPSDEGEVIPWTMQFFMPGTL